MMTNSQESFAGAGTAHAGRPLEVTSACWMVGHRNPDSLLQCNTYLRTFDEDGPPQRVCVDPGSRLDYPVVAANMRALVGDLAEIQSFSLNHQDPDVAGNSDRLCEANPQVRLLVTEDVWRLVRHLGFRPGKVEFANPGRSRWFSINNRKRWQLVPTPFCHFRGAMAFYDPEIRTLFSGDLFGGVNQLGRVHLFAEPGDWSGVAQFHQIYMPSRDVVRYAIQQIRALDPPVEIIAPQHGHIIAGDLVGQFLDQMYDLPMGRDLLDAELDATYLPGYQEAIAELVQWAEEMMDAEEVRRRLTDPSFDDGLEQLLGWEGTDPRLRSGGYTALLLVFLRLTAGEPAEFVNAARGFVLAVCSEPGLPIPAIGTGIEEA
jgi:glyoxylase-like metal-dependent hydrolase (beta-lactamase superfamily II)